MDRKKFLAERQWIRSQLANVADFWLKNGMDAEHGGVYTCLDRSGQIYSTDKSVWMQGRCAWTFSYIYNNIDKNDAYLKIAKSCIDFLEKYCIDNYLKLAK